MAYIRVYVRACVYASVCLRVRCIEIYIPFYGKQTLADLLLIWAGDVDFLEDAVCGEGDPSHPPGRA